MFENAKACLPIAESINFNARRQMVPKCEAGPEGIGMINGDVNECTNVKDYSELKRSAENRK